MMSSVAYNGRVNDRPRQHQIFMCAGLLALLCVTTVSAQVQAPKRPATQRRQPIVAPTTSPAASPGYQFAPTQPAVPIPRVRPVAGRMGRVTQASATQVTVIEPKPSVTGTTKTPAVAKPAPPASPIESEVKAETPLGPGPDFASQLPDDDSHMIQFVEVMQWTVMVLLIAVVVVIGIKKYGRGNLVAPRNTDIAHLATLPVKNFFQAHLLQIGSQKFLVTTDRSGVKTVNPLNAWDDLDSQVLDNDNDAVAA